MIFDYPAAKAERRHGPSGYSSYKSYRPWLRDEFLFRCAYCLKREMWGQITSEFELDHFQPQSISPDLRFDYLNLVYSCRRCNAIKLDQSIDDPLLLLTQEHAVILPDGSLKAESVATIRLIQQLDLNSPTLIRWRQMWIRIVQLAAERDPKLYLQLVGFPDALPNLRRLKPPNNSRPEGVDESCHAKRLQGSLPMIY